MLWYVDTEISKIYLNCYVHKVKGINIGCDSAIHLVVRIFLMINSNCRYRFIITLICILSYKVGCNIYRLLLFIRILFLLPVINVDYSKIK